MSIQSIACAATLAAVSLLSACNSAPKQPGAVAGESTSTIGRWSGSFTAEDQTSGGHARLTVAPDGSVTASLVDSVWKAAHGVGRTGAMTGSIAAGTAQVSIAWSTGQTEKFEGVATAPSYGSMGLTIRQYGSDGNFAKGGSIAFALHEQGVAATPPYGKPTTSQPDLLAQYVGQWRLNFYTADGNNGVGTATISATGEVRGVTIDDAWSDGSTSQAARHGVLVGKIDAAGHLDLAVTWGSSPPQFMQATGYFESAESLVFLLGADIEAVELKGAAMTMTLNRN
ncbi:MAG: hypothetical protein EXS17_03370 [Phycisphaerales bacterium]|nr:hypothetical protein [Phycisphaerales bacterium]